MYSYSLSLFERPFVWKIWKWQRFAKKVKELLGESVSGKTVIANLKLGVTSVFASLVMPFQNFFCCHLCNERPHPFLKRRTLPVVCIEWVSPRLPSLMHVLAGLRARFTKYLTIYHTIVLPSVLWRCWLGCRKGVQPLPLTVSCFSKIQIGFTFLVPAHPGSPGQQQQQQANTNTISDNLTILYVNRT